MKRLSYIEMDEYKVSPHTGEIAHAPCGESLGGAATLADAYALYKDHHYACQVDRGLVVPEAEPHTAGPV